jgi:hypothetical protein
MTDEKEKPDPRQEPTKEALPIIKRKEQRNRDRRRRAQQKESK